MLKPGGLLRVTGTPGNKFARALSPEAARAAGFEVVETTPMIDIHKFGIARRTNGTILEMETATTTTYRKLP